MDSAKRSNIHGVLDLLKSCVEHLSAVIKQSLNCAHVTTDEKATRRIPACAARIATEAGRVFDCCAQCTMNPDDDDLLRHLSAAFSGLASAMHEQAANIAQGSVGERQFADGMKLLTKLSTHTDERANGARVPLCFLCAT